MTAHFYATKRDEGRVLHIGTSADEIMEWWDEARDYYDEDQEIEIWEWCGGPDDEDVIRHVWTGQRWEDA